MEFKDIRLNLRYLGIILLVLSVILAYSVFWITDELNSLAHRSCTLPEAICPFLTTIPAQSTLAYIAIIILVIIGLYLIFKPEEIPQPAERRKKTEEISTSLKGDEKKVYDLITAAEGAIFQSELVEKTGLSKVRVSRVLDGLEGKGLVERRRRGMANMVLLKR